MSGDANFHMERTALTVGGFTQSSVSRSLIELPSSIEKGFAQRFLRIFPRPSFSKFQTLELANERFSDSLGRNSIMYNKGINGCMYIHSGKACKSMER